MKKHKAVIMAGGRGTRLWPVSRTATPKQFQAIASEQTMLQDAYERLRMHYAQEDIYISTTIEYSDEVKRELSHLTDEQIIAEPLSRNTASCMMLIASRVNTHDPESTVAVFPSDAFIGNPEELVAGIVAAEKFIEQQADFTVTFGIVPTRPEVGYGYIRKGAELFAHDAHAIYQTDAFVEKPELVKAQEYLEEGGYYWNAGMFMFDTGAMLKKFATFLPDTAARMDKIAAAYNTDEAFAVLEKEYAGMEDISVDYAIMEKDSQVAIVPLALNWSDVGSWASLKETLVSEKEDHLSRGEHIDVGSTNLMLHGSEKKTIVTMGLKDVVIVDTPDALLVCHMDEAANLSAVVKNLGKDKPELL